MINNQLIEWLSNDIMTLLTKLWMIMKRSFFGEFIQQQNTLFVLVI